MLVGKMQFLILCRQNTLQITTNCSDVVFDGASLARIGACGSWNLMPVALHIKPPEYRKRSVIHWFNHKQWKTVVEPCPQCTTHMPEAAKEVNEKPHCHYLSKKLEQDFWLSQCIVHVSNCIEVMKLKTKQSKKTRVEI